MNRFQSEKSAGKVLSSPHERFVARSFHTLPARRWLKAASVPDRGESIRAGRFLRLRGYQGTIWTRLNRFCQALVRIGTARLRR